MTYINHEVISSLGSDIHAQFENAQPYPHLVIDEFLCPEAYQKILKALPPPRSDERSSDYLFACNKFENPLFDDSSPDLAELRNELVGERFVDFLRQLTGKPVFVDDAFVGGGLHQGGEGSFLDMHADFSRHPVNRNWVRELNILLYLNDGYQEAWGGHLEMVNARSGVADRVAPQGNRMVIMLTKEHTLHGYRKISFPPGLFRTSIASYAYVEDADFRATPDRSTLWQPQDASLLKRTIARFAPRIIAVKRMFLGSSTARRARRSRTEP